MKSIQWTLLASVLFLAGCGPASSFQNTVSENQENGIINGENVSSRTGAGKSVVYLQFLDRKGAYAGFCTAALIAPHVVLTAAHCFDPLILPAANSFRVVFDGRVVPVENLAKTTSRQGLKSRVHPLYNSISKNPRLYDHDVAIASFAGDIPSGYGVAAIDTDTAANYANTTVYAYGYGRYDDYRGNAVDLTSGGLGILRRGAMKISSEYGKTPDRYFISSASKTFLCQGDSGGPQFYNKGSVLKIIGVNSAATGNYVPGTHRVACRGSSQATKIAPVATWIQTEQKKLIK